MDFMASNRACLYWKLQTLTKCFVIYSMWGARTIKPNNLTEMRLTEEMQIVYHWKHLQNSCAASHATHVGHTWKRWTQSKNSNEALRTWGNAAKNNPNTPNHQTNKTEYIYIASRNIVLWALRAFTWDVYNAHGTIEVRCNIRISLWYGILHHSCVLAAHSAQCCMSLHYVL